MCVVTINGLRRAVVSGLFTVIVPSGKVYIYIIQYKNQGRANQAAIKVWQYSRIINRVKVFYKKGDQTKNYEDY